MKNAVSQKFLKLELSTVFVLPLLTIAGVLFTVNSAEARCLPGRPCPVPVPAPHQPRPVPYPAPRPIPVPVVQPAPAPAPCPPGTVYDPAIRRCVSSHAGRQPMRPIPPRTGDPDEISAANIVNQAMSGLSCQQAGDALRRLSNQLLSMAASARAPVIPGRPEPELRRQWREHIRSPKFWSKVWNRMADAYRACDRGCFDDGKAVGEMSATAYCAASIAVEGLPGIGFLEQTPLPVCETAIHVGCVQSYQSTAATYPGCSVYATDSFAGIFAEYTSQDCHL